jgi:F0F1-type ATP synthase assembly protein I
MPDDPDRRPPLTSGFGQAMGVSAELVATTLVGVGLGWLVGGIGARPVFVFVGGLLGGVAGVNAVYRTWNKRH